MLSNTSAWLADRGYVQEHHHVQLTQSMIESWEYEASTDRPSVFSDFSRVGKLRRHHHPARLFDEVLTLSSVQLVSKWHKIYFLF